ncbi:MAG: penicillin-binding protein 1B [Gammaproteobacteria bacterium]|nr:penicillin-binding protein 1B [Gammaproteobacteria bacterium]
MAQKSTARSKRYAGKQQKPTKTSSHWFRNVLVKLVLAGAFVLFCFLGYLDSNVREQFEGKRWAIPARVYASPVELYAGQHLNALKFEQLLKQLNYRVDNQLSIEGSYNKKNDQISVKTRAFDFWDKHEPSRQLTVSFDDTTVINVVDTVQEKEEAIVRMDPVQIGSFYPAIKENRILIKLAETPELLIKGLLASEDRSFYHHLGISLRGIARALVADVKARGMVQGGSTITQQLAKNFYLSSEKRLWRKIQEIFIALILEFRYSKQEILEAYLNEIYLGQDGASAVHGFGLASEFYFGTALRDLNLDQLATLVALVRGPSQYDPRRFPEKTTNRRNLVLDEMAEQDYITPEQAELAKQKKLVVLPRMFNAKNRYPGFLDLIRRQLKQEYREKDLTSDGLKIFTTLDTLIQETLQDTITKKLNQLEKSSRARALESAVVVTRRDSGEIAALASAREETASGFNRALDAVRPIGSLMKPVVYLTALQYPEKYTISTRVSDSDISVDLPSGGNWNPKNYDHRSHGNVSLLTALTKSYNLATVRVGMDIGVARTAKTLKEMGVNREVEIVPSLLLGATSLTPIEVTQLYQTLAGDGFLTLLRGIRAVVAEDGKQLQSYPFVVRQAIDPSTTYLVNTMMQEVMHHGTGHSAYEAFPKDYGLVGKTGTTNDAKDSWFAGYTGDYLSVVWLGRDDNKPIGLTGSTGALQVWTSLMKQISKQPVALIPPENIVTVPIDPVNGFRAANTCKRAIEYPYLSGSEPTAYSACGQEVIDQDKSWFDDLFTE